MRLRLLLLALVAISPFGGCDSQEVALESTPQPSPSILGAPVETKSRPSTAPPSVAPPALSLPTVPAQKVAAPTAPAAVASAAKWAFRPKFFTVYGDAMAGMCFA